MSSTAETSELHMVDLAARHLDVGDEAERRVIEVLRGGCYVGGAVVREAEITAARLLHRQGAVGVNSGTDALILALQAVGVRPGDHVIVPALTFFATAGAVCAVGATPVIVDVGPHGLIDADAVCNAMTKQVKAIIPVHLFGATATVPDVDAWVVDDLAQAVGASTPPRCGPIGAVSTYPTKTWAGAGDGGFVVADDAELLLKVRKLANHGLEGAHEHALVDGVVGRNSRLDAVQAALLLAHAPRLTARVAVRRRNAATYDERLPSAVRPLPRDADHPVHHYVVRVDQRDRVRAELRTRGIHTAVYYPKGLHRQPALAHAVRHSCTVADTLCDEVLALPVHAGLTDNDVHRIIDAVHQVVA